MSLVSEDRMEKALMYLAETDEPAALARAKAERLKVYGKTAKAYGFLDATGTVAEREAISVTTKQYLKWLEDLESAIMDSEQYSNKRSTEAGIREVWRSLNANRRQGG
jgi:vacuolar-type H+-ATPase subunit B/Vma2